MQRRALVTGIGGQDGSLLAELLLERGYEVFGLVRRPVSAHYENLAAIRERIELIQGDLLDQLAVVDVLRNCRPHEVYNLASPSFVPMSWKQPVVTAEFAAVGVTSLLEAIRAVESRSGSTRRPRARSSASPSRCRRPSGRRSRR
jgi:GDPmannose 4,6-dehydratase